jgi:hypothetical protein
MGKPMGSSEGNGGGLRDVVLIVSVVDGELYGDGTLEAILMGHSNERLWNPISRRIGELEPVGDPWASTIPKRD